MSDLAQVTTANDNLFESSASTQLAGQTPALAGAVVSSYTGSVTIGVA